MFDEGRLAERISLAKRPLVVPATPGLFPFLKVIMPHLYKIAVLYIIIYIILYYTYTMVAIDVGKGVE
jgi:hypothetical protein